MNIPLTVIRRSAAEVLASVVADLFPGVLLAGGDVSEIGFHYDFQLRQPIDDNMLILIEEKMRAQAKKADLIETLEMMRENAAELFQHYKQPLIADLVRACSRNIVQIFKMGRFHDFCQGPYVENSKEIGAFKLLRVIPFENGVRIEGTACADNYELKKFLKRIDAAKKCDHRVLGPEMSLFMASEEGYVWLPKGSAIRKALMSLWEEWHNSQGFGMIFSPLTGGSDSKMERFHTLAYQSKPRTCRDLPLRFAECQEVYCQVNPQKVWGLFRNQVFTRDIENIFCTSERAIEEIISSLQFIAETINIFGFEHHWYLCARSKTSKGTKHQWDLNVGRLVMALDKCRIKYEMDTETGSEHGPQIEVRFKDALGREWTGPQVGVNFVYPGQLGLRYQQEKGGFKEPVMITRSIFGSLERMIGLLIEHYEGFIPFWLAPEQVRVIPVGEQNLEYGESVRREIAQEGLRVEIDGRKETLGNKVHAAEQERVPYMVIVGDKEQKDSSISVRSYVQNVAKGGTQIKTFLAQLKEESKLRSTKSVES